MDRTYTGSYGRLKASIGDFLPNQFFLDLLGRDLDGISVALSATSYKDDIEQLSPVYKQPELLDFAINRHLIKKNKLAQFAPPPISKNFLSAYFMKWDIENIKSVMSAKTFGYQTTESDSFLLSYRNLPVGVFAGNMTQEDFRIMISLGSIESIVDYLTKFGIGTYLLMHLDQYRKTKDITDLYSAMDRYHYRMMFENLLFYNGDESIIREYIRELVDSYNLLSVLKSINLEVPWEQVSNYLFPFGKIPMQDLEEAMRSQNVAEAATRFKDHYDLSVQIEDYNRLGRVYPFDLAMRRNLANKFLPMLAMSPVSINSIFHFILRAEIERENLRAIVAGKLYKLSEERIKELLILV